MDIATPLISTERVGSWLKLNMGTHFLIAKRSAQAQTELDDVDVT